ncbi:hypothetical protein SISNIDRAFT_491870 [Sistotremastrum niveocremeum HHB9708]|uniref:Uncharacterized protein n=1 Tax=Sistotremastrum niveocremeum HHB9708 TaxID=1314777 RepID=A0A164MAZ1_9AGAM|nr:hypothetical protein SISNIDRAFT_491870 [Sistotremastrum niveocremeum HHB9708]
MANASTPPGSPVKAFTSRKKGPRAVLADIPQETLSLDLGSDSDPESPSVLTDEYSESPSDMSDEENRHIIPSGSTKRKIKTRHINAPKPQEAVDASKEPDPWDVALEKLTKSAEAKAEVNRGLTQISKSGKPSSKASTRKGKKPAQDLPLRSISLLVYEEGTEAPVMSSKYQKRLADLGLKVSCNADGSPLSYNTAWTEEEMLEKIQSYFPRALKFVDLMIKRSGSGPVQSLLVPLLLEGIYVLDVPDDVEFDGEYARQQLAPQKNRARMAWRSVVYFDIDEYAAWFADQSNPPASSASGPSTNKRKGSANAEDLDADRPKKVARKALSATSPHASGSSPSVSGKRQGKILVRDSDEELGTTSGMGGSKGSGKRNSGQGRGKRKAVGTEVKKLVMEAVHRPARQPPRPRLRSATRTAVAAANNVATVNPAPVAATATHLPQPALVPAPIPVVAPIHIPDDRMLVARNEDDIPAHHFGWDMAETLINPFA